MYNLLHGHPRTRLTESQLDEQVLAVFKAIKQPDQVRDWFATALREWSKHERRDSKARASQLQKEITQLREQQDLPLDTLTFEHQLRLTKNCHRLKCHFFGIFWSGIKTSGN